MKTATSQVKAAAARVGLDIVGFDIDNPTEGTTVNGEWFIAAVGMSKSGKHLKAVLAKVDTENRLSVMLPPETDITTVLAGTRVVDPVVAMAVGGDGETLAAQSVDTPAGKRTYHTVYLLDAASVTKPSGVLARGAALLSSQSVAA